MKLLLIVISLFLVSCGSKKKFSKVDSVENIKSTEQLHADLYSATRLLEFLDIKIRQVETRDSAGNVRIETEAEISKKTEENKQDSTKITGTRQDEEVKASTQESSEKKTGVINSWAWISGFVAVIIVTLATLYLSKRFKPKI